MTQELASAAVSETSAAGTGKIGSALRALRESKGWSVDEVSSRIKFSARQIEALENEQWADLPSGVSLRGLIRNYARLLGADSQAIVESLDPSERVTGPVKLSPRAAFRAFHSQSGADDERSSSASWGWLIAIVLVLAAGVAYAFWQGWLPQHWLAFDWLPAVQVNPVSPMQESSLPCQDAPPPDVGAAPRRATRSVDVKWGERVVTIGGSAPVVVQSMTNTDTADAIATAIQVRNWRWPVPKWCGSRSTRRKPPVKSRPSESSSTAWAWTCRWWATSTTTATSC